MADIMGLTASLDMGSEKMVMAVANVDSRRDCRLVDIKMIASQAVKDGVITDRNKVKSYVKHLLKELVQDKQVDVLNISLSGKVIRVMEQRVSVPLQRKVKEMDLLRAEDRCVELVSAKGEEVVDVIPVAYMVDGREYTTNLVGKEGRILEARFRIYTSDPHYLKDIRLLMEECGVGFVEFFPAVKAYMEVLNVYDSKQRFALIDLGAAHIGVMLFRNGMLEHEVVLPLGSAAIENDIKCEFPSNDLKQAKELKHNYGVAVGSICNSEKIQIPGINKPIEKRSLARVIQCRLEELLEGALYQLQQRRFTESGCEILLSGGGSCTVGTDVLCSKLSGQQVRYAKAQRVLSPKEEVLQAPAYLLALGLLLCEHPEQEKENGGVFNWLSGLFR